MNNQKKNIPKKAAATTAKPKPQQAVKQSTMSNRDMNMALLAGVSIITFICFSFTLHNQFLNWDDWIYITKDKYITSFSAENMNSMLFRDITLNYYHPLTMLSLAVNYQFSQLTPWGYYFTQVLLHILNAIVIFYFTKTLMDAMVKVGYKAIKIIPWLVAAGALIHGIHPMHVESVAWIAERKDLMYSLFYFLGLIMYVRYTQGAKFPWMLYVNIVFALGCLWGVVALKSFALDFTLGGHHFSINDSIIFGVLLILLSGAIVAELKFKNFNIGIYYVLEFFLLSLFSKPMAVSFPLSLITVDLLLKRDLTFYSEGAEKIGNEIKALFKLFIEKWMFLVIAVLSGLQSIILEIGHKTVVLTHGFTLFQKLLISSYAFTMYTVKAFYPANLCSYYPYPSITSEHYLPSEYYAAPLFAALIIFIPIILVRKNKDLARVVIFGIGFYLANLLFILQFLSAGATIISDRYSYVSYFGLIFILVYFAHWYWQQSKSNHFIIQGSLGLICVTLGYFCYERTLVWHNPETLWSDVIDKIDNPAETKHVFQELPYLNLATYYRDSGKYDKAYETYMVMARHNTDQAEVYRDLGNYYGMHNKYDTSLYYFQKALKIDTTDGTIYNNRGITYANMGKPDLAYKDFVKAYALDSTQDGILVQEADMLMLLGRQNDAVQLYNKLIAKSPKEPGNYFRRGNALLRAGNADLAKNDYLKVLELQPNNGECMYDLSQAYDKLGDESNALNYATKANQNGFKVPEDYLNRLQKSTSR